MKNAEALILLNQIDPSIAATKKLHARGAIKALGAECDKRALEIALDNITGEWLILKGEAVLARCD